MAMTRRANDLFHVRRRPENGSEAAVADRVVQIVDEQRIGVDRDQRAVCWQALQHRQAERADAGTVFDENLALRPIDGAQHPVDGKARRRNDRAYHAGMLYKSAKEHAPLPGHAGCLAGKTLAKRRRGKKFVIGQDYPPGDRCRLRSRSLRIGKGRRLLQASLHASSHCQRQNCGVALFPTPWPMPIPPPSIATAPVLKRPRTISRGRIVLLFTVMLVTAAGNTAMQSVMPSIGTALGVSDVWISLAYSWSAILWVTCAPIWAKRSDRRGRKAMMALGLVGFASSMALCGIVLWAGLAGLIPALWTLILFALCRSLYGLFRLGGPASGAGLCRQPHAARRADTGTVAHFLQLRPGNCRGTGAGTVADFPAGRSDRTLHRVCSSRRCDPDRLAAAPAERRAAIRSARQSLRRAVRQ